MEHVVKECVKDLQKFIDCDKSIDLNNFVELNKLITWIVYVVLDNHNKTRDEKK